MGTADMNELPAAQRELYDAKFGQAGSRRISSDLLRHHVFSCKRKAALREDDSGL